MSAFARVAVATAVAALMSRRMLPRVMLVAREGVVRDRLRTSLESRGAEVVLADDETSAARAIRSGGIAGMVVDLDPSPRASGLGVLLAARDHIPAARRVLVVEGRASIADAAVAAGLADRLLSDVANDRRIDAIADWLVTLCDHAPRRGSASVLVSAT